MIVSFLDKATEEIYHGGGAKTSRSFPATLFSSAWRKLDMLDAAVNLSDLGAPPGNRLEPLKGRLHGLHSIRINRQWRIVFRWHAGDAYDVQIADYHKG